MLVDTINLLGAVPSLFGRFALLCPYKQNLLVGGQKVKIIHVLCFLSSHNQLLLLWNLNIFSTLCDLTDLGNL